MNFRILFAAIVIIAVTVVSGILHGKLTLRWETPDSAEFITLGSIPTQIGPWRMSEESDISDSAIYALRADDWIHRTYANPETGERINVAIVAGPSGPISVHLPEICYSSQKYRQIESRKRVSIDRETTGETNDFWLLQLQANDVHASRLLVLYAWSSDGVWQAPDSARKHFAGSSRLLKLQIASVLLEGASEESLENACIRFLKDFSDSVETLESTSSS